MEGNGTDHWWIVWADKIKESTFILSAVIALIALYQWTAKSRKVKRVSDGDVGEGQNEEEGGTEDKDVAHVEVSFQTTPLPKTDPGMVEVSIALSGIATAIAAILQSIATLPEALRLIVAGVAGVIAVFSAYSSLWLLANYCSGEKLSSSGLAEIWDLLSNPNRFRSYWFLAIGLTMWLMLAFFIAVFPIIGTG